MPFRLRIRIRASCRQVAAWLLCGLLLAQAQVAWALEEAPLKAAIVYNLLLYVQWPDEAALSPGAPLVLCAERHGALWPHLSALGGRAVRQLRLELREAGDEGTARACRVWVLEDSGRVPALRADAGLLTIGDGARADGAGVVIALRRGSAGRLAFDVDLVAARHQGLQVSSKMLRLARQVRE
jgi:hypothetical protein